MPGELPSDPTQIIKAALGHLLLRLAPSIAKAREAEVCPSLFD